MVLGELSLGELKSFHLVSLVHTSDTNNLLVIPRKMMQINLYPNSPKNDFNNKFSLIDNEIPNINFMKKSFF